MSVSGVSVCIDRCYCEQKSFALLLNVAKGSGLTLEELSSREGCGTHCGWCVAYLRRALATGESSFSIILPKENLTGTL